MFRIICLLKSNQSYKRIISHFDNDVVSWEDNITSLDLLQDKAIYSTYNLAVLDEKLPWIEDAASFLIKMDLPCLYFTGDFEDIVNNIKTYIPDEAEKEEVLNFSTEEKPVKEEARPEQYKIVRDIEYIEREVPVPVYKSMYAGIDYQIVAVANLSRRAGSSFITMNFARMLASMDVFTCVIEPPFGFPYMFNALGIDKKIDAFRKSDKKYADAPDFYSYPHVIINNEHVLKNRESIVEDIIWAVPDPRLPLIHESTDSWDYYKMMKLVSCTKKAPIRLVDIGSHLYHESIFHFLYEADLILIIVDPSPAECMENKDKLKYVKELKEKGLPIRFVANKWAQGIDNESFTDYLQEDLLMKIPYIPANFIYQSLFEYKLPYDVPEVEDILSKPFTDLAKLLVPIEILTRDKKEVEIKARSYSNILSSFLRRKKQ